MTGEIKQDSISSLNEGIKEERDKKEKVEAPNHGELKGLSDDEPLDLQQFIGAAGCEDAPMTAFLFGDAIPLKISDQQAGTLVQALDWSMKQIKKHWEELGWEDAAIVTVIENQLMNMKLQQKQSIKGEQNVKNAGD